MTTQDKEATLKRRIVRKFWNTILSHLLPKDNGYLESLLLRHVTETGEISYAQCGEDRILAFLFDQHFGIHTPSYLEMGAHHPTFLSNTYLFYRRGSRGVSVEPDPALYAEIQNRRPEDVNLNVGVGVASQDKADFYVMSFSALNTFSKEEAEKCVCEGKHTIQKVVQMPLTPVNEILERYCPRVPDFVSLDVEGLDVQILQTLDFSRYRPKVFCIETISYSEVGDGHKISAIQEIMENNGYFRYADTYINSIFVDKAFWEKRYSQ